MLRSMLLMLALLLPAGAQSQTLPPLAQQVLTELQGLGLTQVQKQQLMLIAFDARSRQQALRSEQAALGDAARELLETGTADLESLAVQQEALTDRRIVAARTTRDALLAFYATLSPGQQTQIQSWLARAFDRLDALRALAGTFAPASPL